MWKGWKEIFSFTPTSPHRNSGFFSWHASQADGCGGLGDIARLSRLCGLCALHETKNSWKFFFSFHGSCKREAWPRPLRKIIGAISLTKCDHLPEPSQSRFLRADIWQNRLSRPRGQILTVVNPNFKKCCPSVNDLFVEAFVAEAPWLS